MGLGAIKYADLSQNRQSDYVFSWDKMLSLQGNTAPYLLYAYTRMRSIFRKGGEEAQSGASGSFCANCRGRICPGAAPAEFWPGRWKRRPRITVRTFFARYLYDLAGHFARFYENCPVLKAEGAARATRLALCDLTARVLKQGLDVLGIEPVEQM